MGYYAGPSSSNTKVVSKSTSRPRISAMQYESQDDEDPGSTDDEMSLAPMGDGYTSELDSEGLQDALNFAQSSKSIEEYHQVYLERAEPVVRQDSDAVSRLEMPLLEGTLIEFLRAAECHGQGLRMIEQIDSDQQRGLRYPGGTNVGDILVANDNSIWIVIRVREDGCIAEITGAPTINEGKPAFQVKELTLLYVWRPVEILRQWCENLSPAEQIAYAKITRLWGVETTPSGRDLDRPVSFLKEIADLLGAKPWKTADVEDDTLLRFAKQHGLQGVDEWASELQVGDVIRMKNGIWGIVLGSSPWRILVQGGKKLGEFNEECMAAKLTLRLEIPDVDYVWCHESFRNLS